MTRLEALLPEGHSKPVGRYSPGLAVAWPDGPTLVFVSGQVATDADGRVLGVDDVGRQTEVIFDRIAGVLAEVGGDLNDLVSLTIFVVDIAANFPAISQVRNRVLADPAPASTLVGVAGLAEPGCLVEINAMAVRR